MPPEVKILYSGFDVGIQVHSGGALTECAPTSNPCRAAYISYCEHIPGASCHDLSPEVVCSWAFSNRLLAVAGGCTKAVKGAGRNRFSWDPLTTLVAVRGASPAGNGVHECTDCDGRNVVNATSGDNVWVPGPKTNQTYCPRGPLGALERP